MIEGVLLLGWGAAERRHLRPYAELYAQRGLPVVSEVLDPAVIWGGANMDAELARIAVRARELEGRLLVHMFSRVGFISYAGVLDSAAGMGLGQRVVAHVFDSGPGVPRELTPARYAEHMASGISSALAGRSGLRVLLRPPLAFALRVQYHLLPAVSRAYAGARSRFAEHAPVVPALCLYAASDEIVAASEVEAFAASERRRGAAVQLCAFEHSRHVAHLRAHPERYLAVLSGFVAEARASRKNL